jgi:uncharacterized membrane protein YqiK
VGPAPPVSAAVVRLAPLIAAAGVVVVLALIAVVLWRVEARYNRAPPKGPR